MIGTPVMSLQTGKELAQTDTAIINPHNLTIIAYRVKGKHLDYDPSYLRIADIREIGNIGMIIDSSDELISDDDIVSDKAIYDMRYDLEGKRVIDEHKTKIGKVSDYIIDIDSFVIQQLVVRKPLLKSFKDDEVLVHRNQIVEVTDDVVVIRSGKNKGHARKKHHGHYVNPFRQSSPQPETIRIDDRR